MISRQGGGSKILKKCEDHYIKSHKKCEDGGLKIVKKGVSVRSYLNGPLSKNSRKKQLQLCRMSNDPLA